ncbi:FAH family protein [Salinisphaera sp. USBA-960]|uniref:AraD1 family protein n=1 Tax=Salinisphaera orenii TaxID=856731 RepID=UPI000DBE0350|nr:FAH family protein [Salifodinibacter halophilus]NNC25821.1 FAH family protein [Salifodinibacter halophilus]
MQLIQFETATRERRVGVVNGDCVTTVNDMATTYALARAAIDARRDLAAEVAFRGTADHPDSLTDLLAAGRVLPPIDHADPHHCLVTGTGLTHTGSADTRDTMHAGADEAELTDSMKMFRWGVDGGRPDTGEAGVQPEWFYKGDGHIVVRPGAELPAPAFGLDLGEEPEIAGLYVVDASGQPHRMGYALANEASDHVTERQNYLYLAHSKLRPCAFGPVLSTGALPHSVAGTSRIWRDSTVLWEKSFVSGEANMSHSLANLEYHHFKYAQFRQPGDVHVHLFGTATLSLADGIETRAGDTFEISAQEFGPALTNPIGRAVSTFTPGSVAML